MNRELPDNDDELLEQLRDAFNKEEEDLRQSVKKAVKAEIEKEDGQ